MSHDQQDHYHDDDLRPITKRDLRDMFRDQHRLTKNGESWRDYLGRWRTPTNIIMILGFTYMIGAEVRQQRVDLASAIAANVISAQVEQELSEHIIDIQDRLRDLASRPSSVSDQDIAEIKRDISLLRDQVAARPTRADFERKIDEEIRPTLERIEQQHQQFMRGRGAGPGGAGS